MFIEIQKQVWNSFNIFCISMKEAGVLLIAGIYFQGRMETKMDASSKLLLAAPASFSKTAFCCCFLLVACLISAEQVPKPLHSTGNGFGPQQAGVVFELAIENEISVCCLPALSTSHSPPLLSPCLGLHHTVVWICHWWMISKTRSCPPHRMWMLGRLWLLHKEWPQF